MPCQLTSCQDERAAQQSQIERMNGKSVRVYMCACVYVCLRLYTSPYWILSLCFTHVKRYEPIKIRWGNEKWAALAYTKLTNCTNRIISSNIHMMQNKTNNRLMYYTRCEYDFLPERRARHAIDRKRNRAVIFAICLNITHDKSISSCIFMSFSTLKALSLC